MVEVQRHNARSLGIDTESWSDPAALDAILLGLGLMRSDAGAPASEWINTGKISDSDHSILEDVGAALALQRAMLTIFTCHSRSYELPCWDENLVKVESRGPLHDALLEADRKTALREGIDAVPPSSIYRYAEGTVNAVLQDALECISSGVFSNEAIGVACDLSGTDDFFEHLPPGRIYQAGKARGEDKQDPSYPLEVRNNLAWIARNPSADEQRTSRYLKAYGTDIDDLMERVEKLVG